MKCMEQCIRRCIVFSEVRDATDDCFQRRQRVRGITVSDVLTMNVILLSSKPKVHLDEMSYEHEVQKGDIHSAVRKVKENVSKTEGFVVLVVFVTMFSETQDEPTVNDKKVGHCTSEDCSLQFVDNIGEESQGDRLGALL